MFELALDIFLCYIFTNIETTLAGTCITFSSDVLAGIFLDRKSTRLNSSHVSEPRMPSSA